MFLAAVRATSELGGRAVPPPERTRSQPATEGAPVISVIVTCHRRRSYVGAALDSLRRQTLSRSAFEVVVTSAFPLREAVSDLGGLEIRSVEVEVPRFGEEVALGVRAARGAVLCFLNDDDLFVPEKLAFVAELFQSDPYLVFYSNSFGVIGPEGEPRPTSRFRRRTRTARKATGSVRVVGRSALHELARRPALAPEFNDSCISVRRSLLASVLPTLSAIPASVDTFLFYAALRSGGAIRIGSEELTGYRVHDANASNLAGREATRALARLHAHALAARESYELAGSLFGPEEGDARRALDELVSIEKVYEVLRRPEPSRRAMGSAIASALRSREEYVWKAERGVLPIALAYLASPTLAQRAYLKEKQIELRG